MKVPKVIEVRGEHTVIVPALVTWKCRQGWEVLYRSRHKDRALRLCDALTPAMLRGEKESHRGWPDAPPKSSPMFSTGPFGDGWSHAVWERHPLFPELDEALYATPSEVDVREALRAIRRAATIGATT